MKRLLSIALYSLGGLLFVSQAKAQTATSPSILELNADVRAFGMGHSLGGESIGMHIYSNPTSLLNNPALKRMHGSYTLTLVPTSLEGQSLKYHAATWGAKLGAMQGVSLGFRALHGLTVPRVNARGEEQEGQIQPMDMTIDLAYSQRWSNSLSTYVSGTYLRSYTGLVGTAWAVSLGLSYRGTYRLAGQMSRYTLGLSVQNVGSALKYRSEEKGLPLPRLLQLAGSTTMVFSPQHRLSLASSCRYISPDELDSQWQFGVGAEYMLATKYMFRTGYNLSSWQKQLTLGLGVRFGSVALNVGYALSSIKNYNQLTLGLNVNL